MKLSSRSFPEMGRIPEAFALGKYDPKTHVTFSENRNPHLFWSDPPPGTRSFLLVCHDPDAPSSTEEVNREDRTVPASRPRTDFTHWVLVDIPADRREIQEGEFSQGVTPRGKKGPECAGGMRAGVNDYTKWFAGDKDMEGTYFGYDGPCPPWNDELAHRYHFTLYALDLETCPVKGAFARDDALKAVQGHVLAQARTTGIYAIHPRATA